MGYARNLRRYDLELGEKNRVKKVERNRPSSFLLAGRQSADFGNVRYLFFALLVADWSAGHPAGLMLCENAPDSLIAHKKGSNYPGFSGVAG